MINFLFGDKPENPIVKMFYYGSILVWFTSLITGIIKIVRNLISGMSGVGGQVLITAISSFIYLLIIRFVSKKADKSFSK